MAQIDGDVEDLPLQDADEFALGMGIDLIVEPADHAIGGVGLVVLYKTVGDAFLLKNLFVIGFEEIAPVVLVYSGFKDDEVRDVGLLKGHGYRLTYCSV